MQMLINVPIIKEEKNSQMSGFCSQTRQNELEVHTSSLVALVECPVLNLKSSWFHSFHKVKYEASVFTGRF